MIKELIINFICVEIYFIHCVFFCGFLFYSVALCSLYGVGPKVADCVCLMSLEKHDAIPVDTHMWQIAAREYLPHLKKLKNVTDKAYKEIGNIEDIIEDIMFFYLLTFL